VLKLKCDEPLSNFAFNFKLRRYTKTLLPAVHSGGKVGRCWFDPVKPQTHVGSTHGFNACN